jgi:hypothetical protein
MKNDKKYWMKRRRYGWGWVPMTWQSSLFILLQLGVITVAALQLPRKPIQPSTGQLVGLILVLVFVVISIIVVGLHTAPKPHWRWGNKDTDNADEDR